MSNLSNEKVIEIVTLVGQKAITDVVAALKQKPDLALSNTPHKLLTLALKLHENECGAHALELLLNNPSFMEKVKDTITEIRER